MRAHSNAWLGRSQARLCVCVPATTTNGLCPQAGGRSVPARAHLRAGGSRSSLQHFSLSAGCVHPVWPVWDVVAPPSFCLRNSSWVLRNVVLRNCKHTTTTTLVARVKKRALHTRWTHRESCENAHGYGNMLAAWSMDWGRHQRQRTHTEGRAHGEYVT